MGLDQYLIHVKPNLLAPWSKGEQIGYWRKDWGLQEHINSDNGEYINVDINFCDDILKSIDDIYENTSDDYWSSNTREAFTKARNLLLSGERILYEADW